MHSRMLGIASDLGTRTLAPMSPHAQILAKKMTSACTLRGSRLPAPLPRGTKGGGRREHTDRMSLGLLGRACLACLPACLPPGTGSVGAE
jgi:hypothetical protein